MSVAKNKKNAEKGNSRKSSSQETTTSGRLKIDGTTTPGRPKKVGKTERARSKDVGTTAPGRQKSARKTGRARTKDVGTTAPGRPSNSTSKKAPSKPASKDNSKKYIVSTGVVICILITVVMLYPSLRNYYIAFRVNEQLLRELAAVEDRNDQIRAQIAYLNTDEGIADRARERFGWTPSGEEAVNITGLSITDSTTVLPAVVPEGSGVAPVSWWTQLLDALFSIDENTSPDPIPDPFFPNHGYG